MKNIKKLPDLQWISLNAMEDRRKILLITSPSGEKASKNHVKNFNFVKTIHINTSEKVRVEKISLPSNGAEVIYAIGSGRVMDVSRFLAEKWSMDVICVPTIISSDAFLVDCTGLRENGCVTYVPSKLANKVILDWEILKNTPARFHLSGCGDVLSIYTALFDWKYASVNHIEEYNKGVAAMADGILNGMLSHAYEIKNEERKGLEAIITALCMEVTLCNLHGNSRSEEGGEHFFTYCIENNMQHFLHGEMVAFGTLLTACIQGQNIHQIKDFMDVVRLNYKPEGLTRNIVIKTLKELPSYVKKHKLSYSIYNNFTFKKDEIEDILDKIGLVV